MPKAKIPIIKGDKISTNIDYRDALPVNMIGIPREILGTSGYLTPHSGLELFGDAVGADRGGVWNDRLQAHFRVSGSQVVIVSTSGAASPIGDIAGTGRASFAYSFNSQAIVAGGSYYRYASGTLERVDDPAVGSPLDVCFVDQYYVFTDGENLYHTKASSETEIDPLDFATAEIQPDETLGVGRDYDNKLMAFGRYTIEYFVNDASENFAFTRIPSRAKSIGIIGTHCKTKLDNAWIILGGRKEEQAAIYLFSASSEQKLSTREIDKILDEYTEQELSEAVLESRTEDSIQLCLIRLKRHTLVYNHTIAKAQGLPFAWSLIRKEIKTDGTWPGANGVYDPRISAWIYGDTQESRLGKLNPDVCTIYGDEIEGIFYTPFIYLERASIDEIEFQTIPGASQQDAKAFVSMTYDGVIYGTEYSMLYGTPYDKTKRFSRYRLGYVSDFVGFKFRFVSKSKMPFAKFEITYG